MKNDKHEQVLSLIEEISNSNPIMEDIFLNGRCFNLYRILAVVFPEALAYYDLNHIITKIDDRYYDITGEVKDITGYHHLDSYWGYPTEDYKKEDINESKYKPRYCRYSRFWGGGKYQYKFELSNKKYFYLKNPNDAKTNHKWIIVTNNKTQAIN